MKTSYGSAANLLLSLLLSLLLAPCSADAIHDAVLGGDVAAVKRLLAEDPKRAAARDKDGRTPVDCAIQTSRMDIVQLLLADTRVSVQIDGATLAAALQALFSAANVS